jgi:hypothetical protein
LGNIYINSKLSFLSAYKTKATTTLAGLAQNNFEILFIISSHQTAALSNFKTSAKGGLSGSVLRRALEVDSDK